jgi:hypothetical protein
VNAVDVLMLDVAKVIHCSPAGKFDTVFFFDRTIDHVAETLLRIPGSVGFAGKFTETVLAPLDERDPLAPPRDQADTLEVRKSQTLQATKRSFIESFPFDVINLDLEDMTFKARDPIPGDVIRSLASLCEWQKRPLLSKSGQELLDGFTLLFTTRIGPAELREDYAAMLLESLQHNIANDGSLADTLRRRKGLDVGQLQEHDFATFFELGVPKVISNVLMDQDWYIEPDPGVLTFRFTRTGTHPYDIVHFAMDVARQMPPRDRRPPRTTPPNVMDAYASFVRRLFETPAQCVTEEVVSGIELKPSLSEIKERRRTYYPDDMA